MACLRPDSNVASVAGRHTQSGQPLIMNNVRVTRITQPDGWRVGDTHRVTFEFDGTVEGLSAGHRQLGIESAALVLNRSNTVCTF